MGRRRLVRPIIIVPWRFHQLQLFNHRLLLFLVLFLFLLAALYPHPSLRTGFAAILLIGLISLRGCADFGRGAGRPWTALTDDFPVNGAVVDLVACSIAGGGRLELFLGQSGGNAVGVGVVVVGRLEGLADLVDDEVDRLERAGRLGDGEEDAG